jgi:hypothetical protein
VYVSVTVLNKERGEREREKERETDGIKSNRTELTVDLIFFWWLMQREFLGDSSYL